MVYALAYPLPKKEIVGSNLEKIYNISMEKIPMVGNAVVGR